MGATHLNNEAIIGAFYFLVKMYPRVFTPIWLMKRCVAA